MNDTSTDTAIAYEALSYPSAILPDLTPDRIATAGLLHGWRGPDPATASVLEVGCGDGVNLIAIGAAWPEARCVGIDLSESAIARGRALAAKAGITNVELHVGDILTYPLTGTPFDYITGHGVYTWVPPVVRAALMRLIGARLSPGGAAYLSFDCLPAASGKAAISRFLRAEIAHLSDPAEQIRAATELVAIFAQNQRPDSRLRADLERLTGKTNYLAAHFYHDWLAQFYEPVSVAEFEAAATVAGLTLAGDAGLSELYRAALSPPGGALVDRQPTVARQLETIDLLQGDTFFRRGLVVRRDQPPAPDGAGVRALRLAFTGARNETADGIVTYTQGGSATNAANPEQRAILDALHAVSPAELTFGELDKATGIAAASLEPLLLSLVTSGMLTGHVTPQPFVTVPGERPRAGRLIRAMLGEGSYAVALRHVRAEVDSEVTRTLLTLCDGTRTRGELRTELETIFSGEIAPGMLEAAILGLGKMALFKA